MINGLLGRKIGMTRVFRPSGEVVPVTVIKAGPCFVVQVKTKEKDGYEAVQLGYGETKRVNKPEKGHLKQLPGLSLLREFKGFDITDVKPGQRVDVGMFKPGDMVDVIGTSKGRGFAGVVKRHGFAGGPRTHGQSDRLRAPGSVGATTTPGRVLKGLRMAGRMGGERVTVQNLEVIEADLEKGLLLVKGAVPGSNKGLLTIRKARGAA